MNNRDRIQISVGCKLNLLQHLYFNQIILPKIWDVIDEHIDSLNELDGFEESEEK